MIRHTIEDDPRLADISKLIGVEELHVLGMLTSLWIWASRCTRDGVTRHASVTYIDKKVNREGFARAMESVGWLVIEDEEITFPDFGKWNFQPNQVQRKQQLDAARQQKKRDKDKSKKAAATPSRSRHAASRVTRHGEGEGEGEKTPPTPSEGDGGEESPGDQEPEVGPARASAPREEIRVVSDDPELAARAKKVVTWYKSKVRTAHPDGGAVVLVMNHMADGIDEADLLRRCDRYGSHCDKNEMAFNKRQGAGAFFGPGGHHSTYDDASFRADSVIPPTAPPPRPVGPSRDGVHADGLRFASRPSQSTK